MDAARRWLAEDGVTQVGSREWTDGENTGQVLSANDVAHSWARAVFIDDRLDVHGQLPLAFGLLDLLDDYWVTCEIRFADQGADGPLPADALWGGYTRRVLECSGPVPWPAKEAAYAAAVRLPARA